MKTGSTIDTVPLRVLLMLGSNVDADRQLDAALAKLRERFDVLAVSARHQSPAMGRTGAPAYLNQAAVIASDLDHGSLKIALRDIEAQLGRLRPSPEPQFCPIDIDALGRWEPEWVVWDARDYGAAHARAPLLDLGIAQEG
jgi:2-amino-4-hydroxy-6-hydroxymethyldihydropteridine diphosphokinase